MMKTVKKLTGLMLILGLLAALLAVPALGAGGGYSLSIEDISDAQWEGAQVRLFAFVNSYKDAVSIEGTEDLGAPVLFKVPVYLNGRKTGGEMSITLVPIRLLSQSLGIPIEWNNEGGYAEITVKGQKVKLYPNATSITMPDGSTFQETEYTFPDGSPINLLLTRNGRLYMPVRAFSELVFENVHFQWTNYTKWLKIYGQSFDYIPETWVGVKDYDEILNEMGIRDFREIIHLPNTRAALEGKKYELGTSTHDYVGVDITGYDSVKYRLAINNYDFEEADGFRKRGIEFYGASGAVFDTSNTFYPVIEAVLKDLVSDSQDVETIMTKLKGAHNFCFRSKDTDWSTWEKDYLSWTAENAYKAFELNSVFMAWGDDYDTLYVYNKDGYSK